MKEDEVIRAIRLLHLWGSCVHFGGSEVLSKYLVADPTFLTQEIMSSLFYPDIAKMIRNGLLPHHYLRDIWPGYISKAEFLLALMEKFEVCFELGDRTQQPQQKDSQPQQPKKDFWERESVITSYLSEQPPSSDFNSGVWADECPKGTSELCRNYTFNCSPVFHSNLERCSSCSATISALALASPIRFQWSLLNIDGVVICLVATRTRCASKACSELGL